MDPATATLAAQGIKLGLQFLFTQMKLAGKTPEEIDAIYQAEKKEFYENHPDHLPDA